MKKYQELLVFALYLHVYATQQINILYIIFTFMLDKESEN